MARAARTSVASVWDEALEPDIRKYIGTVAKEALADEQSKGFDERPIRIVDRTVSAPIEAVQPFGVIEFVSRADLGEAVREIYARLVKISPIFRGNYRKSHLLFLNRVSVGTDVEALLRRYKPGDRIQIVNTMPYAKKIEGRKASKVKGGAIKPLSKQAPNGVYRAVYAWATKRFSKGLFFDFTYRKLDLGVTAMGYQGGAHYTAKKNQGDIRRRKRIRRPIVYPQIQIYQSTAGREGSPT